MSRFQLTRGRLTAFGTALAVFVLGIGAGLLIPPDGPRAALAEVLHHVFGLEHEEEAPEEHHEDENFVELDERQIANLELDLLALEAGAESIDLRVPGRIVERPGFSNLAVTSTVTGVVTRVHVQSGQAVRPNDPIADVQLTGESLAAAQSALVRELAELESVQKEIDRLEPLVQRGTVAGNKLIEERYQKTQVEKRIAARRQELGLYGLTSDQIEAIANGSGLVTEMVIRVPARLVEDIPTTTVSLDDGESESEPDEWRFTIEDLDIHPGKSISPGDALVHLAHHTELFVEGWSYESEAHWVEELEKQGWTVSLETGTEGHEKIEKGLEVVYLDNHVNEQNRTYGFYVRLENEPIKPDRRDDAGHVFRTWKYKPGQLVHVLVPKKKLENVFEVPLTALADDGLDTVVFRKGRTRHGSEGDRIIEKWRFEPIPVRVVHRSSTHAYLEPSDELQPGRVIAENKAHLLLLATKEDKGGGGHGHDHHGHSH